MYNIYNTLSFPLIDMPTYVYTVQEVFEQHHSKRNAVLSFETSTLGFNFGKWFLKIHGLMNTRYKWKLAKI